MVEVTIADDGPGLSAEQRRLALARGVRLDEAAPGSGLGLAIVGDLVELYGGSLALEAAEAGGLLARLRLPGR
jgi:signal transduction histidine kinase